MLKRLKRSRRRAKPSFGHLRFKAKSSPPNVRATKYQCRECRDTFERVVLISDEGNRVVKHWTKSCTKCGSRNLEVVRESNMPLTDGKLYTWDEKK